MVKVDIVGKLYFVVDDVDSLLVVSSFGDIRVNAGDIEDYLNKLGQKFKEIQVFVGDKFLFCIEDTFNVKKRKDALNAAKLKLDTLLHSGKITGYYSFFKVQKSENGFNVKMYYSENRFLQLLEPVFNKFQKKLKIIRPLWEVFSPHSQKGYILANDYITVFGENDMHSTFPLEKYPFEISDEYLKIENLPDYLRKFSDKDPKINFKEDDSLFSMDKIFVPVISAVIGVNLLIAVVLMYKYPKSQNEFLSYKNVVKDKMIALEPLNKTKEEKDMLVKRISAYEENFSKKTYIPQLIRDLSKDMPDIYLENFRYSNSNLSVTVNNIKSQEVIEYLKSRQYIKNASINGKVSVFNDKERFNLGVQFAK